MNKKYSIGIIFLAVILGISFFLWRNYTVKKNRTTPVFNENISLNNPATQPSVAPSAENPTNPRTSNNNDFQSPLDYAPDRITKKPFGIFITKQDSPVQPEKFTGFHTGADFEIFPDELNVEVPVKAVCSGKLVMKKNATGYGGVMVESCELDDKPITVIYGHLKLSSINKNIGENITAGETLGILGANDSQETSGERKHLHLGFHKGAIVNILGYVQTESALSDWVDPCLYVCK